MHIWLNFFQKTRLEASDHRPDVANRAVASEIAPASWSAAVLCRFGFFRAFRNTARFAPTKAAEDCRTPRRWREVPSDSPFRNTLNAFAQASALCFLFATSNTFSRDFRLESAGARYGYAFQVRSESLRQAEAFANWNLPLAWDLNSHWHLQSRLDLSIGWLGGRGDNATVGTAGPSLLLRRASFPLTLDVGASATGLSREKFGSKDFGTPFQFTTHAGVNLDLGQHIRVGYRYQHMSNAGLSRPNPGLNLHVFGLSYLF